MAQAKKRPPYVDYMPRNVKFQYSVKVFCSLLATFPDHILADGLYRTAVNIHNPTDDKLEIALKVSLAKKLSDLTSEESPSGPPLPRKKVVLGTNETVEVDCGDIAGFFCPIDGLCFDFAYLKGYLVIYSPAELDVVAIYTARTPDGQISAMDVEQVRARKIT